MMKQAFSLMQVRFDEVAASAVLDTDVEVRFKLGTFLPFSCGAMFVWILIKKSRDSEYQAFAYARIHKR
jgi:hypothetical protein